MAITVIKTLFDKDNNTCISVHKGDDVQIALVWHPGSGFLWQADTTTAGTLIEIKHEGDSSLLGSPATVIFIFKIEKTGIILLHFARPGTDAAPIKWFQVQVNVE